MSNWTRINDVTNITTTTLEDITSTGTNLLVVGRNMALISDDGSNWVKSAGVGGNFIPLAVKWDGGQFVAAGQDYDFDLSAWVGAIKTSPQGTNWTSRRKEGPILRDLAFGNGKLVAVGDSGLALTSTDGASWTIQDSTLTNGLDGVAFGAGQFVAVSDVSHANPFDPPTESRGRRRILPTMPTWQRLSFYGIVFSPMAGIRRSAIRRTTVRAFCFRISR